MFLPDSTPVKAISNKSDNFHFQILAKIRNSLPYIHTYTLVSLTHANKPCFLMTKYRNGTSVYMVTK